MRNHGRAQGGGHFGIFRCTRKICARAGFFRSPLNELFRLSERLYIEVRTGLWQDLRVTIIYKENVSVVTEGLQKILEIIFRPVGAQKPLNRPKNMQKLFWASGEFV